MFYSYYNNEYVKTKNGVHINNQWFAAIILHIFLCTIPQSAIATFLFPSLRPVYHSPTSHACPTLLCSPTVIFQSVNKYLHN